VKARDGIDQLCGDADRVRRAPHAAFEDGADVQFARDRADVGVVPLNENAEVRAATCSPSISESELSSSSVSPSEKYSWSLSPLMFSNGSTAIECGGGLKAAPQRTRELCR
jgi:hypothetical protein